MGIQQNILRLASHISTISENQNTLPRTHTNTHAGGVTAASFPHLFPLADLLIRVYLRIRHAVDVVLQPVWLLSISLSQIFRELQRPEIFQHLFAKEHGNNSTNDKSLNKAPSPKSQSINLRPVYYLSLSSPRLGREVVYLSALFLPHFLLLSVTCQLAEICMLPYSSCVIAA